MPQTDHDRVIALAGLFQATALVRNIARSGQTDAEDFETCVASVLKIDAASSEEIYGDCQHLRTGLGLLIDQLLRPKNMEITRYVVSLLVLERKLVRKPKLLRRIGEGIESTKAKLEYFPLTHDNIIAALADIYTTTVSTLPPRIMVHGEQNYLTQTENANRIRALLLAGIRAARLWRQSGGGRLTLLLRRRSLIKEAQRVLSQIET